MKFWTDLAVMTIRTPQDAARQVMAMNIPGRELFLALLAVSAVTALLASLRTLIGPPIPEELLAEIPALGLLLSPVLLFCVLAGGLILMIYGFHWVGRAMGGQGSLNDMVAVLTWLQALRAAALVAVTVLGFVMPNLAGLAALGISIFAFWIMLNFLSIALNLGSVLMALGVFVVTCVGLILGTMLVITLFGPAGG